MAINDDRLGSEHVALRVFWTLLVLMLVLGFIAGAITTSIYSDYSSCTVMAPGSPEFPKETGGRSPDGDNQVVHSKVEIQP